MSPDGSNRTRIADLTRPRFGDCYPDSLTSTPGPAWSPDGGELAVMAFNSVFEMHADGTHIWTITKNVNAMGIAWRPVP